MDEINTQGLLQFHNAINPIHYLPIRGFLEGFHFSNTTNLDEIILEKNQIENEYQTIHRKVIRKKDLVEKTNKYLLDTEDLENISDLDIDLDNNDLRNFSGQALLVERSDFRKNGRLNPKLISPDQDQIYSVGYGILIFNFDTKYIIAEYLIQELKEGYVINQHAKSIYEIHELKINVPSIEKQKLIVQTRKLNKLEDAKTIEKVDNNLPFKNFQKIKIIISVGIFISLL